MEGRKKLDWSFGSARIRGKRKRSYSYVSEYPKKSIELFPFICVILFSTLGLMYLF